MEEMSLGTEDRMKTIRRFIDRMPSLSTTATKVLEICNNPNTSANDLNKVISLDPVLAGRVLKLINSAYYSLPNKVNSLTRAIIVLGLNTVKNLALSAAVLDKLGGNQSGLFSMDMFWWHSICAGVTAKKLATYKKVPVHKQEEYFLAGLLHDLGKIPLNACFSEDYQKAIKLAELERCSLQKAENEIFGFDHCRTGKMITEKWQLTDLIIDVLSNHHDPQNGSGDHKDLVVAVALGNIYANYFHIGSAGDTVEESFDIDRIQEISGMNWKEIQSFEEAIKEEIGKAQIFLRIGQGE